MSLATVIWKDGYMQQFRDDEKAVAIEAYQAWKAGEESVKSVTLPPSWRSGAYRSPLPEVPGTIQMEVRGLDDIDTDPEKKKPPLRLTGQDYEERYP
jgi:hypothetical protein